MAVSTMPQAATAGPAAVVNGLGPEAQEQPVREMLAGRVIKPKATMLAVAAAARQRRVSEPMTHFLVHVAAQAVRVLEVPSQVLW